MTSEETGENPWSVRLRETETQPTHISFKIEAILSNTNEDYFNRPRRFSDNYIPSFSKKGTIGGRYAFTRQRCGIPTRNPPANSAKHAQTFY